VVPRRSPILAAVAVLVLVLAGSAAAYERPTLERGDHGRSVKVLQRGLGLRADGIFGPSTERALKRMQRKWGLTADGVAGPATWTKLRRSRARRARSTARRVSASGRTVVRTRGSAVRRLQRVLGVTADGVFGPGTLRAVRPRRRCKALT
jgi:peptidoglycan hydrolase-like protein with peptidoglycan-binding domain